MSFSPEFLDELRSRLRLSEVVGRKVRLVRRGREFTGLCPFHSEKTPSFTVNDDKAFYHCFGCGAHGDAISFLTGTEGLGFPEAVERLAGEAGMALPARDPKAEERARERASLKDVQALAARWFESQLWSSGGKGALDYLRRRGLSDETIRRFHLGFAPGRNDGLLEALRARHVEEDQLRESGLVIYPEDGRAPLDRFRHRVMFPILDLKGDAVAFGGRALDDAPAKYLNSPETPLFHKGHMLYHLNDARSPARESGKLVVVEGYMDVIGLSNMGINEAVAPLGTALTEDQIQLLWRVVPEPVLCFDGDNAGMRAAARAMERALGLLKPGYSLSFAMLPAGEDPDSLVQKEGRAAFDEVLNGARSLSDMLWGMLSEGATLDTPERRAGFERQVMGRLNEIADPSVQAFYRDDFRQRIRALFNARSGDGGGRNGPHRSYRRTRAAGGFPSGRSRYGAIQEGPTGRLRMTALARDGAAARARGREQLLLLCLVNHPSLIDAHFEEIAAIEILNPDLDNLRREIIGISALHDSLDMDQMRRHLKALGLEGLLRSLDSAMASLWAVKPEAALVDVEALWQRTKAIHHNQLTLERELKALERELALNLDDETNARFRALMNEINLGEGLEANLEGFGIASGRKKPV